MVATRRSLPNHAGSDNDDNDEAIATKPAATSSHQNGGTVTDSTAKPPTKQVKNALRKLQIDGTAALAGDRASRPQKQASLGTYHYRGAVYDITADTPQEWIDQQPMRYRRRDSSVSAMATRNGKSVRKRKLAEMQDESDTSEAVDMESAEEKDDDGESAAEQDDEMAEVEEQLVEGDDQEEPEQAQERPKKRRRRDTSNRTVAQYRTRSSGPISSTYRTRSSAPLNRGEDIQQQRRKRRQYQQQQKQQLRESYPTRRQDYRPSLPRTCRASDLTTRIAKARDKARGKGFQVEPLNELNAHPRFSRQMRHKMNLLILKLGRVNSRHLKLSEAYRGMKARGDFHGIWRSMPHSPEASAQAGAADVANEKDDESKPEPRNREAQAYISPASTEQQVRDQGQGHAHSSTTSHEPLSTPASHVDNDDSDDDAATPSPPQKGLLALAYSPSTQQPESDATCSSTPNLRSDRTPHIPSPIAASTQKSMPAELYARNGQAKLPTPSARRAAAAAPQLATTEHNEPSNYRLLQPHALDNSIPVLWSPKLSHSRHNETRAEHALNDHRKRAETPAALQRRIYRELAILRAWPELKQPPAATAVAGSGIAGAAATVPDVDMRAGVNRGKLNDAIPA